MKKWFTVLVGCLLILSFSGMSLAGPLNPLFVKADSINANEQLEFRTGKNGAADWEIGLGMNTQSAGNFQSMSVYDPTWWTIDEIYSFDYAINSSYEATFSIFGSDGTSLGSLAWTNMDLGNTLQIHAKRDVVITVGAMTLTGNPSDAWGVDYGYLTIDPINGFSLNGTIKFTAIGSGGSTQGATFKTGNLPSVPEPATMLLLGLGLVGLAGVRRKM